MATCTNSSATTFFNANEFFLNRAAQKRPSVKQNIFGASLGGPIGPGAKTRLLLLELSGNAPAQRAFAGHVHQQLRIPHPACRPSAENLAALF